MIYSIEIYQAPQEIAWRLSADTLKKAKHLGEFRGKGFFKTEIAKVRQVKPGETIRWRLYRQFKEWRPVTESEVPATLW